MAKARIDFTKFFSWSSKGHLSPIPGDPYVPDTFLLLSAHSLSFFPTYLLTFEKSSSFCFYPLILILFLLSPHTNSPLKTHLLSSFIRSISVFFYPISFLLLSAALSSMTVRQYNIVQHILYVYFVFSHGRNSFCFHSTLSTKHGGVLLYIWFKIMFWISISYDHFYFYLLCTYQEI